MKRLLLGLIGFYRRSISPLMRPCCRFTPTCSQYALEAVEKHGAWRGTLLAIWRVLRCHPLNKGGYDPVPETFTLFKPRCRLLDDDSKPNTDSLLSQLSGDLSDPSDHPPAG